MNRVREFRRRHKMQQHELAAHSGVAQCELSKIENEVGPVLVRHAKRIAEVFGVKPEAIFTDGMRRPAYYHDHLPRRDGGIFAPWTDPDVALCHWCGFPFDTNEESPLKVKVNGRWRVYGHKKCQQEHIDTINYA